MDEFIWDVVTNNQEIKDFFKDSPRIYPNGITRSDPKSPYIVWVNIHETPRFGISDKSLSSKHKVQFDIYASTGIQAKILGELVEEAFRGKGIAALRLGPLPEAGTKLYRRTIDMSFILKGK